MEVYRRRRKGEEEGGGGRKEIVMGARGGMHGFIFCRTSTKQALLDILVK